MTKKEYFKHILLRFLKENNLIEMYNYALRYMVENVHHSHGYINYYKNHIHSNKDLTFIDAAIDYAYNSARNQYVNYNCSHIFDITLVWSSVNHIFSIRNQNHGLFGWSSVHNKFNRFYTQLNKN